MPAERFICAGCAGPVELRSLLEPDDAGHCPACNITWDRDDLAPESDIDLVREAIANASKKITGIDPRNN